MCDIGFCVVKIIRSDIDQAMPCFEACTFNLRQVANVVKGKETKGKENFMFNESMIKGKRKRD